MVTTKQALAGIGIATGVGIAIALLSGDASASGGGGDRRLPWTEPLELPTGDEITEVKTVICTLDRGGVETSDLLQATLEHVYPGVPWGELLSLGAVDGDDPSVWSAVQLITVLVQQYFGLTPNEREAWCAGPTPPIVVPPPPMPPAPGPAPGPTTTVPSNVIGGGWNDWPEKSTWQTQGAIGVSLGTLGYAVTGDPLSAAFKITAAKNRDAVKAFQRDFNAFRQKDVQSGGVCTPLVPPTVLARYQSTPKKLTVDGWIGPNTWKAMRFAFRLHAVQGASWPNFVVACKGI